MAKIAKTMLATRSPVFCEFIGAFLRSRPTLSAKIRHVIKEVGAIDLNRLGGSGEPPLPASAERRGLHQDANDRQADKHNE
jgi:hypothetical protein